MVKRNFQWKTCYALLLFLIFIYFFTMKTDIETRATVKYRTSKPSFISSDNSVCYVLRFTKLDNQSIAIVRLLGPSLPPLQSPQQMSYNLKHLLHHETSLRHSQECVKSLWIVGCNYNFTERNLIISTLIAHSQNYSGMFLFPSCV